MSTYEVEGADRLARTAERAADRLADIDQTAGPDATRSLANEAAQAAPRQTGRLASSHRAEAGEVVVTAPYAPFVHWGTRYMRGRPWLTTTARRSTSWVDAYATDLDTIVEHIEGA